MSIGPLVTALTGVPAGRIVDRFGARRMIRRRARSRWRPVRSLLSVTPTTLGIPGYIAADRASSTLGYALFQTANNTAVMSDIAPDQRGVVSGLLNLSRNLGLITGASVMGAVFAFASARGGDMAGMQVTFAVAAGLMVLAFAMAAASRKG